MNTILAILVTALLMMLGFSAYLYTRLLKIMRELSSIKKLVIEHDNSMTRKFVVNAAPTETPAPNEATNIEEDVVPLDEQHPWSIPKDVKLEVEGGDTLAPPGYEVTNG